jgi:hypothetical protein
VPVLFDPLRVAKTLVKRTLTEQFPLLDGIKIQDNDDPIDGIRTAVIRGLGPRLNMVQDRMNDGRNLLIELPSGYRSAPQPLRRLHRLAEIAGE